MFSQNLKMFDAAFTQDMCSSAFDLDLKEFFESDCAILCKQSNLLPKAFHNIKLTELI